jgi:hypothetical protein
MGVGISIFLLAVGAVLYFAVSTTVAGLSISTVGVILMVIGLLGLVVSLAMLQMARRPVVVSRPVVDSGVRTTVVHDEVPPLR